MSAPGRKLSLATGCIRPTGAAAGSVDHAAVRGRPDPAHALRIVAITDNGDRGLIALARARLTLGRLLNNGNVPSHLYSFFYFYQFLDMFGAVMHAATFCDVVQPVGWDSAIFDVVKF